MNNETNKCTGLTESGYKCNMRQNCLRWVNYSLDDEVYVQVITAPKCIEHTPLECPLKITAHKDTAK